MKRKIMLFGGESEKIFREFLKFRPITKGLMLFLNTSCLPHQLFRLKKEKLLTVIGE
jgi:hypothetical protein